MMTGYRFLLTTTLALIVGAVTVHAGTPEENLAQGKAFLESNAKQDGINTTASGLQYQIIKPGAGAQPAAASSVTVHYRGVTLDGKEFDSSYKRGQPATFPLNRVIPGWTEGVQLMREGAHYKLFIPAELAYGKRGAGPVIEPNSTLIFDIELLKVN
ncbi:MAG: FKBP-type peptidyl-prolyl cis-trans isomerase [Methylococcales bacterium]|nr:FKBP-type peptidyl-prolyl cis-trans isomerase [Methylococcales bacterium]